MKTKTLIERITAQNDADFNERVNAFILEHDVARVVYTADPNMVYIEYIIQVSETREEEMSLKGEHHYCGECPYLERSKDGRVRKHLCTKHGKLRRDSAPCCDWYLEKGELNVSKTGRTNEGTGSAFGGHSGHDPRVSDCDLQSIFGKDGFFAIRERNSGDVSECSGR